MEKCPYYGTSGMVLTESKTIRAGRNRPKPSVKKDEWCDHEKSPRKRDCIGKISCGGRMEACTIHAFD